MKTPFTSTVPELRDYDGVNTPFPVKPSPLPAPALPPSRAAASPISIDAKPSWPFTAPQAPAPAVQSVVSAAPAGSAIRPAPPSSSLSREVLDAPDVSTRTVLLKSQLGGQLTDKEARQLARRARVEENIAARGGRVRGGRGIAVEGEAQTGASPFSIPETRYTGPSIGDVTGETARRGAFELATQREQTRVAEREADRAERRAWREEDRADREAERVSTAAGKAADSAEIERLRAQGKKFLRLPDGRILVAKNPDGSDRFEEVRDVKEPGGWLISRNARGEVARRRAALVTGADTESGSMRWKYGEGEFEDAGHLLDLAKSEEPEVAKAAQAEMTRRLGEVRRAAAQPGWNRVNKATLALESARSELGEIPKRIEALNTRMAAAEKAGQIEFSSGGVMGKFSGEGRKWRAKGPEAQALLDELDALKAREVDLIRGTREDFRGGIMGDLVKARDAALAGKNALREQLRGGNLEGMIESRRAWLEQNGGDVEGDEVLAELEKAGRKLGLRREAKGRLPSGPREFYDGPRSWDEVDQAELDTGPKGEAKAETATQPEPEEDEPDEVGRILEWHGFRVPDYGGNVAMSREVEAGVRRLLQGEALVNLERYGKGSERARGLFGSAVKVAERAAAEKLGKEGAK